MKISDLKTRLTIHQVAQHLGITVHPKTNRAHCPFHADKTPSLQLSQEKQIATCFSSKCTAGTMDIISLTEKKLNLSTSEAIHHLSQLTGASPTPPATPKEATTQTPAPPDYQHDLEQMQSSFLASSTARKYIESRAIDWKNMYIPIGYNALKNSRFPYLRGCVVFALLNSHGEPVSLYGRSIRNNDKARHYYTTGRQGLYPCYPATDTQRLILTESVIDTASLASFPAINIAYSLLALYGTNGLNAEHIQAIQRIEQLTEIILFFDGDIAGHAANEKQGHYLQQLFPELSLSVVLTPEGEDINTLTQAYGEEGLQKLLKERIPFASYTTTAATSPVLPEPKPLSNHLPTPQSKAEGFTVTNPNKITYITPTAVYHIKGGIRKDLDSLKVTLVIEHLTTRTKSRNKLDLYEDKQSEKISRESAEKLGLRADQIEHDLNHLTDLLDQYREERLEQDQEETKPIIIPIAEREKCQSFLRKARLLPRINQLIGQSGVVGEENNRIFLFGIGSSYKMRDTLHALIQGSSGSGKTHLLATIMDFMPPEDTISLTRVTESSFYNYGKYELQNKLIGMEDYDGLEEKAELAFRELQSKGMISSSTSGKNEQTGEISGFIKEVYGPIASLSATTRGEIYEDNMSRCFLVAVDESYEQTLRIVRYQNQRAAGTINEDQQTDIRDFLRNCIRLIQPHKVVNPFADKIELPKEAHKIRRLNDLFQSYVKQITLLNQYQRQKDNQGRLITDKEDIKTAIEIMFDSIILKVDELDGSLRNFYEKLKAYILEKGKEYEFTRLEIRQSLKISKTQLHSNLNQLLELEYIQQAGGYANRGFKYKIQYWDNNDKLRSGIRTYLNQQIAAL